ncbi:MAG: Ig-like domain-containing protein [Polyangiaceae bacterium]
MSVTAPTRWRRRHRSCSTTITASATDSDGTISKVDFYVDGVLLGTDSVGPTYGFAWNNAAAGGYTLTAKATDNNGAVTTSAAVVVTVNAAPTVSITAPSNNASFTAGLDVPITATAADSDGAVVKVEFYADGALIGTDLTAPYAFTWLAVPAGTYALTAKATDDNGGTTTSAIVNINVSPP